MNAVHSNDTLLQGSLGCLVDFPIHFPFFLAPPPLLALAVLLLNGTHQSGPGLVWVAVYVCLPYWTQPLEGRDWILFLTLSLLCYLTQQMPRK